MPEDAETWNEARRWLFTLQARGWRTSLDEMRNAMSRLGNPERKLTAIHVAGTNGKGSVCAMASSILQAAGLKVGLYISPHLIDIRERITINDQKIGKERLAELTSRTRQTLEGGDTSPTELSFFEFVTAIAIIYFVEEEVDVAIMETGFGGRLDATNILPSSVSAITSIGFDHTDYLGKTLEAIAGEKAGIIKEGCGVVSSAGDPSAMAVIRKRAHDLRCSLIEQEKDFGARNVRADLSDTSFDYEGTRGLKGVKTNLLGKHQAENAATAIAACDVLAHREGLEIGDEQILKGIRNVFWPGRLDIVSREPLLILDCAHNPSAIGRALSSISDLGLTPDTLVFASSKDKDYRANASILFPKAKRLILTRYGNQRSMEPEKLAELPEAQGRTTRLAKDISEALEIARDVTPKNETILVTGSVFLIGDALSWLKHGEKGDFSLAGF